MTPTASWPVGVGDMLLEGDLCVDGGDLRFGIDLFSVELVIGLHRPSKTRAWVETVDKKGSRMELVRDQWSCMVNNGWRRL